MYEYIKGIFKGIQKDYIIIENNGIGYKIFSSGNTMSEMPDINKDTVLYLEQIVRQDFIGLYGFSSKEELELFDRLLTVNGVGPKAALSLLSIATPANLKKAIVFQEDAILLRAPGIGKKTAQRIILELKDRFSKESFADGTAQAVTGQKELEAKDALIALGYTEKEAEKVLKEINTGKSVEEIIKDALLKLMSR